MALWVFLGTGANVDLSSVFTDHNPLKSRHPWRTGGDVDVTVILPERKNCMPLSPLWNTVV